MHRYKKIAACAVILILFLAEAVMPESLSIYGGRPELLLIATIFFGFYFGKIRGATAGFISGILKDIFSVGPFGINALSFLFIGFLSGYLKDKLFKESFITQFFFSCFIAMGIGFFQALCQMITPLPISILAKGLYTGLLAPFLFFALTKIFVPRGGLN